MGRWRERLARRPRPQRSAHAARLRRRVRLDLRDALGFRSGHDRGQARHRGAEGRDLLSQRVVGRRVLAEPQLDRHRRPRHGRARPAGRGRARSGLAGAGADELAAAAALDRRHPRRQLARRTSLRRLRPRDGDALLARAAPRGRRLHRHGPAARLREVLPDGRHPRPAQQSHPAVRRLHPLAGAADAADPPLHRLPLPRRLRRDGRAALRRRSRPRNLPAGDVVRHFRIHRLRSDGYARGRQHAAARFAVSRHRRGRPAQHVRQGRFHHRLQGRGLRRQRQLQPGDEQRHALHGQRRVGQRRLRLGRVGPRPQRRHELLALRQGDLAGAGSDGLRRRQEHRLHLSGQPDRVPQCAARRRQGPARRHPHLRLELEQRVVLEPQVEPALRADGHRRLRHRRRDRGTALRFFARYLTLEPRRRDGARTVRAGPRRHRRDERARVRLDLPLPGRRFSRHELRLGPGHRQERAVARRAGPVTFELDCHDRLANG